MTRMGTATATPAPRRLEGPQVASGDVAVKPAGDLPRGWAETVSGRLSGVTEPGELSVHYPFPNYQLATLDDALTYGSRQSKARFSVYIGDLGNDTNAGARDVFLKVPTPDEAVLIAVSPDQHVVEVVYGEALKGRGAESAADLGVAAALAAFKEGNLLDGIISAVRVMSAAIARP
ncbi:DUF5130 domain-containing protein [Mycobacteroides abscessus]|uniref:DUF5130 domain-containing protein n=1 Tax=Mycobacteroides abscessus subsp. bolletii 50594 TaxID=1303024 RepID=A0AB33A938_9MYCO|nr:hypothetical protein MASS_1665 [Mycobacteroides abscessus subsp. bolletii 50594]AWG55189.1 DUF5130 domain-containing protein [Mycobacteroides abscessus]QCO27225.1 DUF5130 domain-containing protein [Mycobacteroides abscessus subsp. massiliense]AWG59973.1 DUF5130 domain-containing protein [Mycobacteroides abscessus]AWG69153.1 DUF5130 domain-containing protein [Mycobacteroides abscessus]